MVDLITRLEAAEEGSRELDGEIQQEIVGFDPDMLPQIWPDIGSAPKDPWPHYTTSFDSALMLLPERWEPYAARWYPDHVWVHIARGEGKLIEASAPTPALALCIAALKAREHSNG